MKNLSERLNKAMEDGALTKRDLQRWFGRSYATVRCWIIGQQEPWAVWREDVEQKLLALERLVRDRKHLPVPPSYSPADRSELIQALIHERDTAVSRNRSAARR
jgi:hypothetical protein